MSKVYLRRRQSQVKMFYHDLTCKSTGKMVLFISERHPLRTYDEMLDIWINQCNLHLVYRL